jgi:hypothetical protein
MYAETDQWGLQTRVCDARGGLPGGGGGEAEAGGLEGNGGGSATGGAEAKGVRAAVFESSGYIAKLARRYISEWASRARRAQGREGEGGKSSASTRARRNLSSAVHYWDVAATISYMRAALLVQLPTGELAEEGGGVA